MMDGAMQAGLRITREYIASHGVNLEGLTVFTEAASGHYAFTPLMCALAGARHVFAVTRDSQWASAGEVRDRTLSVARSLGLEKRISVRLEKRREDVAEADIVTNSGFVRPLDRQFISWMKETAVIPLMWEVWEHEPGQLDLKACRENGVLVLGTDEAAMGFWRYAGMLDVRLLLDCGVSVYNSSVFVISSEPVGRGVRDALVGGGARIGWTGFDEHPDVEYLESYIPPHDRKAMLDFLVTADAVVCDEKRFSRQLVGPQGLLDPEELKEVNPGLVLINRSGVLDYPSVRGSGIRLYPDIEIGPGASSVCTNTLGLRPVLELTAAGLKVGEAMARARLSGLPPEDAALHALKHSPAMDFYRPGGGRGPAVRDETLDLTGGQYASHSR